VRPTSDIATAISSPRPPFDQLREVQREDIDAQGHVNNVVYLAWVNDIAIAHWASLTDDAARARLIWVALRHEIDYKAEALLGDTVRVRTWTGAARGLRYARHTQIFRDADHTLLAEALTYWCPMDAATRKPTRPSADITALFGKS
jgi:acyl-CoA thioester hydrolase